MSGPTRRQQYAQPQQQQAAPSQQHQQHPQQYQRYIPQQQYYAYATPAAQPYGSSSYPAAQQYYPQHSQQQLVPQHLQYYQQAAYPAYGAPQQTAGYPDPAAQDSTLYSAYVPSDTAAISQHLAQTSLDAGPDSAYSTEGGMQAAGSLQASSPSNAGSRLSPAGHLTPSGNSTGHSPRPSSGRSRMQSFVFPPSDHAQSDEALNINHDDNVTTESRQQPTTTSLPSRPLLTSSSSAASSYPSSSAASRPGSGSRSPMHVPGLGMNPIAPTQPTRGYTGPSYTTAPHTYPHSQAPRNQSGPAPTVGNAAAAVQSEISLRYPVLPALPARVLSPPPELAQSSAQPSADSPSNAQKEYVEWLRATIKVYEQRDEILRMRTEAVGFQPRRAWQAWQKGQKADENEPPAESSEADEDDDDAAHPILGVRLLQQVDRLTRENEELGRMLQEHIASKSEVNEPSENDKAELTTLRNEVADCHRLIDAMDAALTKAETRAANAERALEVACATNSTAIVSNAAAESLASPSMKGLMDDSKPRDQQQQSQANSGGVAKARKDNRDVQKDKERPSQTMTGSDKPASGSRGGHGRGGQGRSGGGGGGGGRRGGGSGGARRTPGSAPAGAK
ncbi:hypothetical protein BCV70DRAFT_231518 [Testicularia cyperi]|uniref:Uncharacterized protein n=1 Tax=Testicularia cyperi TaxID=1882483 RepID=A0A317XTS9_9BASI|nr:hypothetical protein BCV70DRAFT_231518 [Testicularia cyperi]